VQVGKLGLNLEQNPDQKSEAAIHFGTGKIHGQFYQDKLCLGRGTACMDANFIGTDYESESPFTECAFDGIMGLGFKDLSMGDGFNMIDDVVSQHSLPHNQFSVYLKDHESGSEISFGGYKRSQAASDVLWAPVTRESYWQIAIDDVTFNNKKTGLCSNCQVAVDTGTSLLAGPSEVIEQLGSKLDVKMDCSNFKSLPKLGFAIGEKVLNLLPEDYIDHAVTPMRSICVLSLMTLDVPPPKGPLFIFGDPFLRRYLTIYDRVGGPDGSPRVGFAVAQHQGVTAEFAETLIASTSGHKKSNGNGQSHSEQAEADLINMHSVTIALATPKEATADAASSPTSKQSSTDSSALRGTHQPASGNKKKAPEEHKKKASGAGMLQTTTLDDVDLVTVSLEQISKRH
jgi:hypothetical protein